MDVHSFAFPEEKIPEPFDFHYLTGYNSSGLKNLMSLVLMSSCREAEAIPGVQWGKNILLFFYSLHLQKVAYARTAYNK